MTLGTYVWLLRQSLISTLDDGCFGYAKAAAYSALLCFFPVLTSAAAILTNYADEPDWKMDQDLNLSPLQVLTGGSQGRRHKYYG